MGIKLPKAQFQKLLKLVNPDLLLGEDHIFSKNPMVYLSNHEVTWPVYDINKDEFEPDASEYLSNEEMKDLEDIIHDQYHFKVFCFEENDDVYDMYTEFTVVSPNKDVAWQMIREKYDHNTDDSFLNDRSKYKVTELNLGEPTVIGHYSRG